MNCLCTVVITKIFISSITSITSSSNLWMFPKSFFVKAGMKHIVENCHCLSHYQTVLVNGVFVMLVYVQMVTASQRLHNSMLNSILHQSMAFFDTTPVGRILNRYDLSSVFIKIKNLIARKFIKFICFFSFFLP